MENYLSNAVTYFAYHDSIYMYKSQLWFYKLLLDHYGNYIENFLRKNANEFMLEPFYNFADKYKFGMVRFHKVLSSQIYWFFNVKECSHISECTSEPNLGIENSTATIFMEREFDLSYNLLTNQNMLIFMEI